MLEDIKSLICDRRLITIKLLMGLALIKSSQLRSFYSRRNFYLILLPFILYYSKKYMSIDAFFKRLAMRMFSHTIVDKKIIADDNHISVFYHKNVIPVFYMIASDVDQKVLFTISFFHLFTHILLRKVGAPFSARFINRYQVNHECVVQTLDLGANMINLPSDHLMYNHVIIFLCSIYLVNGEFHRLFNCFF